MSEWKRNKRRTNGYPKGVKDGAVLEVRFRNGKIDQRTAGRHLDEGYFNTADGSPHDVMAYRVVSEPAAAPAIATPDYSKGFPVGTTAKDIGAKVGDKFEHIRDGEKYTLTADDGSLAPIFTDSIGRDWSIMWDFLAPIPPKTAIELQAEEVGIPEPVQLVDDEQDEAAPTNKYQRTIKGVTVDVYDVLAAFGVTCQARGHAIKKLLMAGQRGHKDEAQDLREAVQAIYRSIELVDKKQ